MPVAQSTFSARSEDSFFAVLGNFKQDFVGFKIAHHRSEWHFNNFVFTIVPGTARASAIAAPVAGEG